MDEAKYNSIAWDEEVNRGNYWTRIARQEDVQDAKEGKIRIRITPTAFVPLGWIEGLKGKRVLNLAGAGGQQTILLSAFGANVVTVDISKNQIAQDEKGLKAYSLEAELHNRDMRDLSFLDDESFDAAICPHSLNFIPSTVQFYREVYKKLKKGGLFLFGVANPALYLFDEKKEEKENKLEVKYTLPYSDEKSQSKKKIEKMKRKKDTFEFSHTLSAIIGDLLKTGFSIRDFYSDEAGAEPVDSFVYDSFLAFCCIKEDGCIFRRLQG